MKIEQHLEAINKALAAMDGDLDEAKSFIAWYQVDNKIPKGTFVVTGSTLIAGRTRHVASVRDRSPGAAQHQCPSCNGWCFAPRPGSVSALGLHQCGHCAEHHVVNYDRARSAIRTAPIDYDRGTLTKIPRVKSPLARGT